MMNPNEIAGKRFDKTMGRYRPEEVETYLRQVADEMNALLSEKQDLENKIMVLADKLEEYRQDEESLRSALIGAQKLGDSVVREAKAKAATLIEEAKGRSNQLMDNAKRAIESEKNAYARMQREVATFKSKLQLLYKQHLELISSIPVDQDFLAATTAAAPQPEPPQPAYEPPLEPFEAHADDADLLPPLDFDEPEDDREDAEELQYSERPLEYSVESTYDEQPESEPEPEPRGSKRESRFGPLKFGKEFDIREDKRKK